MGSTGRSTGTHLHFEVRTRDRYGSDVNPRSWLGR
jgi:murein DD-endopeptidase MepM/ murein hydrolase activator NlpD